jgi:hypothetical protein
MSFEVLPFALGRSGKSAGVRADAIGGNRNTVTSLLSLKLRPTLEMSALRGKAESFPFIRKTFALFMNRLNDASLGRTAPELLCLTLLSPTNSAGHGTRLLGATNWLNGSMPKKRGISYSSGCGSGSTLGRL